jgi:hypothetical protein
MAAEHLQTDIGAEYIAIVMAFFEQRQVSNA